MQKKSEAFPKKIYLKPALEERLAQILAVPLTVAAAPFGYGAVYKRQNQHGSVGCLYCFGLFWIKAC